MELAIEKKVTKNIIKGRTESVSNPLVKMSLLDPLFSPKARFFFHCTKHWSFFLLNFKSLKDIFHKYIFLSSLDFRLHNALNRGNLQTFVVRMGKKSVKGELRFTDSLPETR